MEQQHGNDHGCDTAGKHGRERSAGYAPLEYKNQDRVADQVDDVDQPGNQHGNTRITLRAEQRRTRIINCQNGVGKHADGQIGQRTVHHIVLN